MNEIFVKIGTLQETPFSMAERQLEKKTLVKNNNSTYWNNNEVS